MALLDRGITVACSADGRMIGATAAPPAAGPGRRILR
jgi:hypothetical protein